ncbi:hypothetical protein BH24ACT3_BH24ACT3_11330 [soil metagenome]
MADHAHLSIGEVLSLLQEQFPDVTISKIRFLESQGLLDPERTPSGYRKFYEPDIERLRWILRQQREHFLPLKVIKDRLDEADADGGGVPCTDAVAEASGRAPTADQALQTAPVEAAPVAPVPAWMADVARAAASRTPAVREEKGARAAHPAPEIAPTQDGGEGEADAGSSSAQDRLAEERRRTTPLDRGPTTVSLTQDELAGACGLTLAQVKQLEEYGLLVPHVVGADQFFDGDALVVAKKAAGFLLRGLEARHLRMFKMAAEREAGFLEQVAMPMLKQRNPAARQQALDTMGELALLGQGMRAALLRQALRNTTRTP